MNSFSYMIDNLATNYKVYDLYHSVMATRFFKAYRPTRAKKHPIFLCQDDVVYKFIKRIDYGFTPGFYFSLNFFFIAETTKPAVFFDGLNGISSELTITIPFPFFVNTTLLKKEKNTSS